MAILIKNQHISEKLVISGAKYYYSDTDELKDLSPIFLACEKENTQLLELMCDHGAKMNVLNSKGQTPLMFASS